MLNILGISRFIKLAETSDGWVFAVAVGVLPYPVTFLCTDFISELYGRAARILWSGRVDAQRVGRVHPLAGRCAAGVRTGGPGDRADRPRCRRQPASVFSDPCPGVWRGHRIHARLHGSSILRCVPIPLLEEIHEGQTPLATQQRLDPNQPDGRHGGGDLHHVLRGRIKKCDSGRHALTRQLLLLIFTGYAFKFVIAMLDTIPFYVGTHI